nr:hypothetical protein Hi04_10k_c3883_00011 [uncultured bacterium]
MSAADHALHLFAYVAMRALSPTKAHALVIRAGAWLPQRHSPDAVKTAAARLRRGTCLSRALTIAARAPGSEVVIGVSSPQEFEAHAWVELDGVPLRSDDPRGVEIVRLRR